MSWTDAFPVLSDQMLESCMAKKPFDIDSIYQNWFEVEKIINPSYDHGHLVATCLFWKRDLILQGELPSITRESLINATQSDTLSRFAPWETYVLPIIECSKILRKSRPDVALRIYLANDLSFLIDDLVASGCEVHLMKGSSIRHNPGAMWRFLALEDSTCPVTIIDSDRGLNVMSDIARTEAALRTGVGGWRLPYEYECPGTEGYRPMTASQFGSLVSYPMRLLMQAFILHNIQNEMPTTCKLQGLRETSIAGTHWPDYGFDEWFLLAVMYPRMAEHGLLTFVPWDLPSLGQFFALDIEYCTWANPKSELINYPNPELALGDVIRPWAEWKDEAPINVRSETTVIKRYRKRIGACQGVFNHAQRDGIEKFPEYGGNLASFLAGASANVSKPWFVDLNPQLYLSSDGGELFLDRRYDDCDVAFCGYYFIRMTPDIAEWAKRNELDEKLWGEGKLLKVPKLEGPMTLWRTEFSRKFHQELIEQVPFVKAEILLRAWMDQGKVRTAETTAKQMGWAVR